MELKNKINLDYNEALKAKDRSKISVPIARFAESKDLNDYDEARFWAIKLSVKEISGLVDSDGKPFELEFDSNGCLEDSCAEALCAFDGDEKLTTACLAIYRGFPKEKFLIDDQGKKVEGIEFLLGKKRKKSK